MDNNPKNQPNVSIISRLPEDHFGTLTSQVLNHLTHGQSCVVYSLPGGGVDYFSKQIQLLIHQKYPKVNTITLSMEMENDKISVIKKEISKLAKNKIQDEIDIKKYLENKKLIIIINDVASLKYKKFYKYLNALRRINKDNLTTLSTGYTSLYLKSNEFLKRAYHVFHPMYRIANFDYEGVKQIIKINNDHYGWEVPLSLSKKILFLSGGLPSLVKHISYEVEKKGKKILKMKKKLMKTQPINYRLTQIANLIPKLSLEDQFHLGIINNNGTLFADLLKEYLKTNEIENLDKLFPNLTKTDRRILSLFVRNMNTIIDKDQLSIVLDQTADTYSQWAIYKAVARVRDKIKDRYKIKTLRGRGWIMESK